MCACFSCCIYQIFDLGTIFSVFDSALLAVFVVRYIVIIFIAILSVIHFLSRSLPQSKTQPLLSSLDRNPNYGYGSTSSSHLEGHPIEPDKISSVSNFFSKLKKVLPFIWPQNNLKLQLTVLLCFALMVIGLVINVFTPLQIGKLVDGMKDNPGKFAWATVLSFIALKFLQGGSGLIQVIQNWLWIPIAQHTTRNISVKMFSHLHSLSIQFHIDRKTGEVLRVMDRGTSSIVQLLNQIVFQVFPALANILIAVFVFYSRFSPPFGLIVLATMVLYLYATIKLTEWRNNFRRQMNMIDNDARAKAVDSLLNFETVKYYGNEEYEIERYKNAIVEYQKADWKCSISLNILNLTQNTIITTGLLAGSLLFAWEVSRGQLTAGDFVAFNIYMMQLYTPLHFFGMYYRMIQQSFIDMEKMLELFEEKNTIQDVPDAKELVIKQGDVIFDNVSFSYNSSQANLKNISFSIPKGTTAALVGPSGGGKSTLLRLLFRFYDPTSGRILIDGQDISKVKQNSLRDKIGVVPQDTVLFNDTILYNIRYGDVEATEEQVINAAKAAQIHDRIMSFPDGYNTKVGERGLRLSGGEKQRVAIARTILKNTSVILLDEATSALDNTTERQIQIALDKMTEDRTTLVIAHRLSTIVNANLILVIKDGQIVESGSHEELIKQTASKINKGVYFEMWQKQQNEEKESLTKVEANEANN
ncbi:hypothetical protein PHYBLDRAFT_131334 [Phycomyces blakesleeanus NRRL 1555(-)]|uniref:ABC transporter n=1 Tax=Phycomyces blakesleeanus (strain ATCC 8743b / DSM 1359 / FGSC 10004 / NBRC 33097 / NRRL 1555) TaxID=763407 RepID=A0A162Y130_PHYB8|nr:hypothetical protein PHYBLDRAFT_131334 [Phycomyces blakesleeanus NRRL 1555(-)]OAD77785.1 hypothetical protein PHYBLDRAFT_131334 [Phycomyces blakesleeanus NRRL 1555(-)]|eukprot:XP_018295825.1 hypothetical protein PHYBLDRAFT_131334 [Phycomyces blakesleeanus NRRL 1555(-)]